MAALPLTATTGTATGTTPFTRAASPAASASTAARPRRRPGWAHPALTGMTASNWDQLTAALAVPYQAQREAERHIARGGPATRRRAGGHPQAMTLAEKTLVTIMRQRLAVPRPVLADLFGVAPDTIGTAERQIKPLLSTGRPHHRARRDPAHHPGRPHRIRNSPGHHPHAKDQTSALITDKPLVRHDHE